MYVNKIVQTTWSYATRHLKTSANLLLRKIHDNDFTNDFETAVGCNKFLRKAFNPKWPFYVVEQ